MNYFRRVILANLFLLFYLHSFSQVSKVIQLDSVTIEAVKRGFDVSDFVDWVQKDTTFYKAFKNLHFYPYSMESKLTLFNKSKEEKGVLQRKAQQKVSNRKRWLIITEEKVDGKIFKKKEKFTSYTAEMLDYIFFPADTLPASNIIRENDGRKNPDSKNEKNQEKLKTLIFNPGAEVGGVPLIGNRMAIFDEKMIKHYDYKIFADTFNHIPCYVFSCKAKQTAEHEIDDKAVIKELSTWFDKRTLNVVARTYTLSYKSILFDFDVKMDIKLEEINKALVPVSIFYSGYWDIPFRKPEVVDFDIRFSEYEIVPGQ